MILTRLDLFNLVWSQPRTALALRFGVSDVAVAKKCRSADIPMPPPGYWARIAAGGGRKRPALPLRMPGASDLVPIGEPRYGVPAKEETEPKPPHFPENVETLVAAALKRIGRVRAQRDLTDAHSGLARVLRKEEERRQKFVETKWSYYAPQFADSGSLRQLRLFSTFFRAFDNLAIKGSVSEDQEWKQGIGTTYRLSGSLEFGGAWVKLIFVPDKALPKPTAFTLLVGGDDESKAHSVWSDQPSQPIERQLDAIVRAILVCAEERMRKHAQQVYEWSIQRREESVRELQEQERAKAAALAAQVQRNLEARRKALYAVAAQRTRAQDIRATVVALKEARADLVTEPSFLSWCEFALAEADRIDPVHAKLADLLRIPATSLATSAGPAD